MRVLHILSGDLWGGAEAQMGLQIKAQRELGLESRVLLFNSGETERRYLDNQIPTNVIKEVDGFFNLLSLAREKFKESPTDLIVSHGYKETIVASYLSLREKIPFISTIHGGTESYKGLRALKATGYYTVSNLLARFLGTATIVPTEELRQKLRLGSHLIPNVADINPRNINESELRQSLGLSSSDALVIWVGRIVPVKRLDRVIEAFALLKTRGLKANLLIVGDGELKVEIEQLVRELELRDRIRFLGFRSDAPDLIGVSDLLVLSSESEGLPTVMAEAMVRGIKLVMSDLPGIREVADRFSDYPIELVSPQTSEKFSESIERNLSTDKPISSELIQDIREWFDPKRAAREAHSLFLKII